MQEEYSSKRVGIYNIAMFFFTGIFVFLFSLFTGKSDDLIIRNTIVSLLFCGTVIFMLQDDYRRGEKSFYYDNYLNVHRYFIAYIVMVVLSCVFSMVSYVLWPYMCVFVILAALSNFEIGLISGIGFVCLSIMLETDPSICELIMYVLAGAVAITLMRDPKQEKGIVLPVFISLLMQAVLIAAFCILFEESTVSGRLVIMPLINIMINMVVLFVFLNFMSVYIIGKETDEANESASLEKSDVKDWSEGNEASDELSLEKGPSMENVGSEEEEISLTGEMEVAKAGSEEGGLGENDASKAAEDIEKERDGESAGTSREAEKPASDADTGRLPETGITRAKLSDGAILLSDSLQGDATESSENRQTEVKAENEEPLPDKTKVEAEEEENRLNKALVDTADEESSEEAAATGRQEAKSKEATTVKRKRRRTKKKVLNMTLNVENEVQAEFDFNVNELAYEVAECVLKLEGCTDEVEVELIITDDEGIQELNRNFREIDSPTDVLSFPNVSYDKAGDFSVLSGKQRIDLLDPDTGKIMFGEIVINEKRVRSQALEYGHSQKREFSFLVAHSMLHLCGYDHMEEEEALVMEKKQEEALEKLGITRD